MDSTGRPVDVRRGALTEVPADGGPAVDATGGLAAGLFGSRSDVAGPQPRRDRLPGPALAVVVHRRRGGSRPLLVAAARQRRPRSGRPRRHACSARTGPVETVATDGITLAPHAVRRIDLADIAPQTDDLAVEVQTSPRPGGRVRDRLLRARGHGPARPGVAGRHGPARAGPSASPACPQRPRRARCWSRTRPTSRPRSTCASPASRARSRPTGLDPITVAPGAIETVDLRGVLPKGEPVALRLRSRVPVVAVGAGHRRGRPRLRDAGDAARRAGRRARRTRGRVHASS